MPTLAAASEATVSPRLMLPKSTKMKRMKTAITIQMIQLKYFKLSRNVFNMGNFLSFAGREDGELYQSRGMAATFRAAPNSCFLKTLC